MLIVEKLNQKKLTCLLHLLHCNVLMLEILLEEIDRMSKESTYSCQSNIIFSWEIIPIKKHLIIISSHLSIEFKQNFKRKKPTSHLRICSIILCSTSDEIDDDERNCSNRRAIQRRSTSL